MPEYPNTNADTGIRGMDTVDPERYLLERHRQGLHSGRRWQEDCRHCVEARESISLVTEKRDPQHRMRTPLGVPEKEHMAWIDGYTEGHEEGVKTGKKAALDEVAGLKEGALGTDTIASDGPEYSPEEAELRQIWRDLSREEEDKIVPKAIEYGAADLEVMGEGMRLLLNVGLPERNWSPAETQELACAFYALGKVARAFGAYGQGVFPSDDTWHDLGVYARMIQVIRRRGRWM